MLDCNRSLDIFC